jgi:hypothetical protein
MPHQILFHLWKTHRRKARLVLELTIRHVSKLSLTDNSDVPIQVSDLSHFLCVEMLFNLAFRSPSPMRSKVEQTKFPEVHGGPSYLSIRTNSALLAVAALVAIQVCVGILFKCVPVHDA